MGVYRDLLGCPLLPLNGLRFVLIPCFKIILGLSNAYYYPNDLKIARFDIMTRNGTKPNSMRR